ncbi:hypothetical protein ABMA28_000077 [Loxostege sticticalis]|uniref:Ig-like domain-containing protein n=1 Tax=Loxostege sticticalis TaxID=481309 RepID=A0ABD0TR21_LOXSC
MFISCIMSSATERTLRAVRNYDARLPCGQGKIFLDGPDAYVLWVKDDEKFLYRFPNEDTVAKSLNPNNIYGTSCVDTDHCYDDTSLLLPKVGDNDAGKYRCRVHYQGSSSVDYVVNLQIVEATGTPKLFDERGEQIVTPYVGPLTLGSNLSMICEVVISEPPTTVVWLRNGVTVRRIVSDKPGILRERVDIVEASRDELDAHYQCTASNADVTDAMAASVVVKMYLPPLKVEIRLNNNLNFEVGQPRVVDCVVVGCVPTPTINWYIGGTLLKASAHKELHDGNYTVSSLTFTASKRDNKKWLSCRVHNAYLPTIYEDNVTLNVGHRPTCITADIRMVGITPGEEEEISCAVKSSEPPRQFKWTFPDQRSIFTSPTLVPGLTNTYTTTLTWVPTNSDIGRLECSTENEFGEQKELCLYNLVLSGAPTAPICRQVELPPSEDIQISCEPGWDGGSPQSFHLEVRNSLGEIVHRDANTSGNFTLPTDVSTTDNLTVTTFAQNSRGKSTEQSMPLRSTATYYQNDRRTTFWEQVLILSTVTGFAVISAAAGIYTIISRRRDQRRNRLEGLFHREPDFAQERAQGSVLECHQGSCQNLILSTCANVAIPVSSYDNLN